MLIYLMFLIMLFTPIKGINGLLSKWMSNIYLKTTIDKNWLSENFDFLGSKEVTLLVFRELQLMKISLNIQTSCCNLKIRGLAAKLCVDCLCFFNFEMNYFVLKSLTKNFVLLNKNINFNKSEMESKMENPTYSFREMNLALHLI